jgi:hypothetical protein
MIKSKMPVLLYGLICGIALIIYIRLLDISKVIYDTSWGAYLGYLAILILPACIFLTLREIKIKNASIRFKQALTAGLLVSCITATVYSAYVFVDINFFDARHLNNLFEYTVNTMKKEGYSPTDIQNRIGVMKTHYFSAKPYVSTYIWYLVLGTFFSIIFFFLLRKSNPKNQII